MQIIPLRALPAQKLRITLNSQACSITLREKYLYDIQLQSQPSPLNPDDAKLPGTIDGFVYYTEQVLPSDPLVPDIDLDKVQLTHNALKLTYQSVPLTYGNPLYNVMVKTPQLYLDLYVNDVLMVAGVPCNNMSYIVRAPYLGFLGDMVFFDTQGNANPVSSGLNSRWFLLYLAPGDL